MGSYFGNNMKISVFGQSHSEGIGIVIDGFPAGFSIDMDALNRFMARRAPGRNEYSTKRNEADEPRFLSGVVDNITCGAPICAVIMNTDTRSKDYKNIMDIPRPAHADFTAQYKFGGFQDVRGGGHFSGRLTAPLCIAGAICMQYLASKGIHIGAHISSIGGIHDTRFNPLGESVELLDRIKTDDFPVIDPTAKEAMQAKILEAKADADSVGGSIECIVTGLPIGIGDPMFGGLENVISSAVFAVPAIKGIEFGNGFACAELRGSENNDPYYYAEDGSIRTSTNNHGGILGGISSGMPLLFRVAVKPTPSIGKEQQSISFSERKDAPLVIHGRHDPCILPRAVPCIEAVTAIALADLLIN